MQKLLEMCTPIIEHISYMHVPIDMLQGSLSILGTCAVLVAAWNQAAFKIEKRQWKYVEIWESRPPAVI